MKIDTARVWPIYLFFLIINLIPTYFALFPTFLIVIIPMVLYGACTLSLRKDASKAQLGLIGLVVHFLTYAAFNGLIFVTFFIVPLVMFTPFVIIMYYLANQEVKMFDRTILSLNSKDRELARKAMKTKKIEDISKVAEYASFDT